MEESKKKFSFPKEPIGLGIIISLLVFVVFSLVDTLIYYFSDMIITLSTPMFSFLSILLLSGVVVLSVLKGKKLLGSIFFLLTLIVDRGFAFIRNLIFGAVSLSTFDDFYQFIALIILGYLVVIIILQLKKERPTFDKICPRSYLLPLLVIGYSLVFNGFNSTLAIILVFAVLFLLGETSFIGWYVAAMFIFGLSNIIDFIIFKSMIKGYNQTFGFWMNNVLIIALFVLGVISIFKPAAFILKKKAALKLAVEKTLNESPAEAKEPVNEAQVMEKEAQEDKIEEQVIEKGKKEVESEENPPEE